MKFPSWVPAIVVGLLLLLGSVFVVSEGQAAIVLNLGKVVRTDIGPGLHFKVPLIESVRWRICWGTRTRDVAGQYVSVSP